MVHATPASIDFNFGAAWIAFALAVSLHVADEASHDFLAVYNPNALAIRRRFHVPVPVFSYRRWITLLALGISVLLLLTPVAFHGELWLRMAAVPLAVIVGIGNGLLHIGGSLHYHRAMAGILSSPALLAAGVWLLLSALS